MKRIKKLSIIVIVSIIMLVGLCGCSSDMTGSWYQEHIYVDKETGVNYLIINSDSGITVTPRYDKNGNIYIKEEK